MQPENKSLQCYQFLKGYAWFKTLALSVQRQQCYHTLSKKFMINEMLPAKYGMLVIEMLARTKRYKTK